MELYTGLYFHLSMQSQLADYYNNPIKTPGQTNLRFSNSNHSLKLKQTKVMSRLITKLTNQ